MFKCLPILTEKCLIIEKNSLYHTMSAEENNVDSILFIFRMWGSRNWGNEKFF